MPLLSTAVPVLIVGRIVQAIGGNATWIIGLATIADTVGSDNTSRTLSTISMFYMSGMLVGPIVSGTLLPLVGYWPTWGTAIALLVVDMWMRIVMIENPVEVNKNQGPKQNGSTASNGDVESSVPEADHNSSADETTGLLASPSSESSQTASSDNFYRILLTNPQALTGMACHMTAGLVLTSLDTTLPLHVMREFGWDTARISLMFLLVQIPFLILGPLTGWLKDRVGSKVPTGVGYVGSGLMMWLLGVPGKDGFSFAGIGERGQLIYAASLLGLGLSRSLTTGSGILEMTSQFS
jgi:MFS family permease